MQPQKKSPIDKRLWLNIAVYALTGVLAIFLVRWISGNYDGSDRKMYLGLMLVAAYFFGRFANWLVFRIFGVDISK